MSSITGALDSWKMSSSIRLRFPQGRRDDGERPPDSFYEPRQNILPGNFQREHRPPVMVRPEPPWGANIAAGDTGQRIHEDDDVFATFNHAAARSMVKRLKRTCISRSWSLELATTSLLGAFKIGYLLGAFINEEDHHVDFRMVLGNSVGDRLRE